MYSNYQQKLTNKHSGNDFFWAFVDRQETWKGFHLTNFQRQVVSSSKEEKMR